MRQIRTFNAVTVVLLVHERVIAIETCILFFFSASSGTYQVV